MKQEGYHKLISGQDLCFGAAVLRFFLRGAATLYAMIVGLRNFLYSKGWLKAYRVNASVISVGNITVGGTGKTPLVIWLYRFLQQKEFPCAVLTRGYKTQATKTDEPAVLAKNCPGAKVIVNPDRVAGARQAIEKLGAKVVIMDDGFQHRRLGRDLDIVTIDATEPFGYGRLLPGGLLREPLFSLKRANAVVITRCDQTNENKLSWIEDQLRKVNWHITIAKSVHTPVCAKSSDGREISIEKLKDKNIFAFCGIGNPQAFFRTLKRLGANLVGSKVYNDHYRYTAGDIADIYEQAKVSRADLILSTEKDSTKIAPLIPSNNDIDLAYLAVQMKFLAGEDKLKKLIEIALAGKICSK